MTKATVKEEKRYKRGKRVDMESYSDYPDAVKNNAKRGIELNEKEGNKCATQTGKVRAQQLAQGEPISEETIRRMYSYLSRAEEYYDPSDTSACGTISYLLWGGKAGLRWAKYQAPSRKQDPNKTRRLLRYAIHTLPTVTAMTAANSARRW